MLNVNVISGRRKLLTTIGAAGICAAMPVRAQAAFPSRPIKIVIGLPAGGAADSVLRLVSEHVGRRLGQPIIIENKPGGLYQIAVQAVLNAPADGYTLMYINSSFVAVQAVHKRFDLLRDFQPLLKTNETPSLVVVSMQSPFKTMQDMLAHGRAHPGSLSYGTLGSGSYEHLGGLALEQAGRFQGLAVPYKGGPDMVNAVIGGNIDFTQINVLTASQLIAAGKLRPLAARHGKRLESHPQVPTLKELGVDLPLPALWGGYAVRANTPSAISEKLRSEVEAGFKEPSVSSQLTTLGLVPSFSESPAEFRKLIEDEGVVLSRLAKQLNLSTE